MTPRSTRHSDGDGAASRDVEDALRPSEERVHDATDRAQIEEVLRTIVDQQASLLRLSKALEQAQTYSEVLGAARTELEEVLGYHSIWSFLLSEDRETVRLLSTQGPISDVQEAFSVQPTRGDRFIEEVMVSDGPVVVEDAQTDPRTNKELAGQMGSRTIIIVPLRLAGRKLGSLGTGTFGQEGILVPDKNGLDYLAAMAGHVAVSFVRIQLLDERRQVEEALRQSQTDLEAKVRLLEAVNVELTRSNDDLEQFAYAASHDLSEPLRAIAGPLSLLARQYSGQLDDEADRFIGFAVEGCERMQAMIGDLLTYSRVGRIEAPLEPVDLNTVVDNILMALGPVITETDAVVTAGPLPVVTGERAQLVQNLVSNGLKFVRAGVAPRVAIAAEQVDGEIRFTVTDNGIGIDPRHRERIFGMFKRLHPRADAPDVNFTPVSSRQCRGA